MSLFGDCTSRLRASAYEPEVCVVLGMTALGLRLLAKVVWPNYDLQPFVLLLRYEWATLQRHRAGARCWPGAERAGLLAAWRCLQIPG